MTHKVESTNLLPMLADKDETILLALLSEYARRWRHSNIQIWSIGSVFIPLSLSGIIVGLDNKYETLGVAFFSIILIWIWYFTSVGLRYLIDCDFRVYAAIESALLNLDPPCLKFGIRELAVDPAKKTVSLSKVRLLIPIVVTIAWISIVFISFVLL